MTRPPFHPSLKRAAFSPSLPAATPFPLDAAPPPPMLRQQSSIASYASHGGSSSLDDMESDVEGLVMSFLTYSEVLRVSLTCTGLRARWPALRDSLETVALDPTGAHPALTPRRFFGPLVGSDHWQKGGPPVLHPMRRLRRLLVRGGPVALLDAGGGGGEGGEWGPREAAAQWRLSSPVLRGLRGLFPRLVELDLAGCRLGLQGATELAMGVRLGGGWPFLRRIDLRNNLISSAAFTRLAEAFCAAPSGVSAAAATKTGHANAHGSSRSRHRTACSPRHDDDDEDDGEAAPLPPYCPPPRLEEINLENNAIGPEAFTGPVRARLPPTLLRFNLRDNHIGDAGVSALSLLLGDGYDGGGGEEGSSVPEGERVEGGQCPALQELCLGYNDIGPIGLRALAAALRTGRLSQLRRLELSGNNLVGGEPLPDGADPAQWQALLPFLEEGGRDERAMQAFAGALEADTCPRLAVLELDDADLVDGGLAAIARALKHGHCADLKELNLGGGSNVLRGPGLDALTEALAAPRGPRRLERLSLDGCEELPAATITRFLQRALLAAHPLGTPPSMPDKAQSASSSRSSSSDDDDDGKTTTPDRPFALATLRELSLRGLRVSDDGARAIADAMARGALRELRRLSLDFTDVSDRGLEALVAALQSGPACPCPRLEALRLRCSLVSNAGAHALVGLLLGLGRGGEGKGDGEEEETESGPAMRPARLLALKEVDLGSSSVVNSEKLRRLKLRLGRLRPGLAFTYESL